MGRAASDDRNTQDGYYVPRTLAYLAFLELLLVDKLLMHLLRHLLRHLVVMLVVLVVLLLVNRAILDLGGGILHFRSRLDLRRGGVPDDEECNRNGKRAESACYARSETVAKYGSI